MKKKFLIGFVILLGFVGFGMAANLENDCSLISTQQTDDFRAQYSDVLPYTDFLIARSHLLAYCCNEKLLSNSELCNDKNLPNVYPQSPFWFDHLVDVGFRRLDVVGAYPGQTIDIGAKDWNNYITQNGVLNPGSIKKIYEENRKISNGAETLEKWKNTDIAEKYLGYCYWAAFIMYPALTNTNTQVPQVYYRNCIQKAQSNIDNQYRLTKILMMQKSITMLNDSLKSYAVDEFVQNRLMKLLDKVTNIVQLFTKIKAQAPLCKECSK